MKKLLFFAFAAALCCGLTACGGDDDNNGGGDEGNYAELLVGSWKVEKEFSEGDWDIWDPDEVEDVYFFGPNGSGYNTGWEESGGSVYEWNEKFTYELVDKRIFIYYEEEYGYADTDFWVIKKLTNTELVVQEVDEDDGEVEEEIYFRRTF